MKYAYKCPECDDIFFAVVKDDTYGCNWFYCEYDGDLEYLGEVPDESQAYGNDCKGGCET